MGNNSDPNNCPMENEGNIVNVNCRDDVGDYPSTEPKQFLLTPKESPEKYCCFDIYMTRFWVVENADILNPAAGIILMGYANEQSGVAPGIATRLHAHPKHGWINLNQKIGEFKIKENESFPVLIRADVVEWGNGLDGQSDVGSDLEGDNAGEQILLECNANKVPVTRLSVKLQRPKGGDAGRVAIEFAAFRKSCC